MIQFKGEPSEECKEYLFRQLLKVSIIQMCVLLIVFNVPVVLLVIFVHKVIAVFFIPTVLIPVFLPIYDSMKGHDNRKYPRTVEIEDDAISLEGDKLSHCMSVSNVKVVYDEGAWYYIKFASFPKSYYFVCQKDLLAEGTIEEFETLFQGLIVVRNREEETSVS